MMIEIKNHERAFIVNKNNICYAERFDNERESVLKIFFQNSPPLTFISDIGFQNYLEVETMNDVYELICS